jgi:hypothetical protein
VRRQPDIWIGAATLVLSAFLGSAAAGQAPAGGPATEAPSQAVSDETKKLPEVTIEAQRRSIERQAHSFVYNITDRVNDLDSLARWDRPICPLVAGITVEQGEAVLTRLSQIAIAAKAPLAPQHCKPNFEVVVTSDPEGLLKSWRHHDRFMFGRLPPPNGEQPIQQFMHSTHPIRVWYNADLTGNAGETPSDDVYALGRDFEGAPAVSVTNNPRMSQSALLKLISVIVVVDGTRVKGYTVGQLADYIGMIGMAQVNPNFDPSTAPSILRLFATSSSAGDRPDGLSSWDRAFLKGLYTTDQGSMWQRGQIVTRVVKELAP